jgi:uncharacterized protein YyaL (SSP411 family)
MIAKYPLGFGQWLQGLAYALSKPREIAIVGDPQSADTQALLDVVRDGYQPFQVAALGAADAVGRIAAVPLLQDRGLVERRAEAYRCRGSACQSPVVEPAMLPTRLDSR